MSRRGDRGRGGGGGGSIKNSGNEWLAGWMDGWMDRLTKERYWWVRVVGKQGRRSTLRAILFELFPSPGVWLRTLATQLPSVTTANWVSKVKWSVALYCAFSIWICSKAHYNDQFTPSRPKAHIGASGSRFNAVHVCWFSFYRPRKDGKLSGLQREEKVTQIFNPRRGWGLSLGPSGWEAEI